MNLYERAQETLRAQEQKKAVRKQKIQSIDVWLIIPIVLFAGAMVAASGWSLTALAQAFGFPSWAAWALFVVIDLVWLHSVLVVIKNRRAPHRAMEAHSRANLMFLISLAANFAHGVVVDGLTVTGIGAGLAYCLAPLGFKMAFSNVFPDRLKVARKAGMAKTLSDAWKTEIVMEIQASMDGLAAELEPNTANEQAELVREQSEQVPNTTALTSANRVPEQFGQLPSTAERARELLANGSDKKAAVAAILAADPTAKQSSVEATVRREARKLDGPYL
jgi:hypothetical protein